MTSKSQKHSIVSSLQLSGKKTAWRVILGIALLGVFLVGSTQAAVFTVNSPSDVVDASAGNGVCETAPGNGVCTLRAAIQEANALTGADQIILPPNTYLLTIVTELTITGNLTITGGGASTTIIDGNKSLRPNRGVLTINTSGTTVNISGVTIRNGGKTTSAGGGITNNGTLTLINSTVSGNSAGDFGGGGISSLGTLTLINSTVSGNSANSGGGISSLGTMTLINSTVSGNSVATFFVSGGFTIGGHGGGILNVLSTGTLTMINSTVSGNTANTDGGGIFNVGTANVFNSTITDNRADADLDGSGIGGGVFSSSSGPFNFQNSVIAGNFETLAVPAGGVVIHLPTPRECVGTINSIGNNLMLVPNCTVNGSGLTVAAPLLGPLLNNGGPTQTHALLAGSPAIDGGNPSGCRDQFGALLQKDQRGLLRTVGSRCDIGAFEFGSRPGFTVNFDVDFDGDGRNDIGVYRDGTWFILRSSDGGVTATAWGGLPQDIPVPGDYDGDGKTDVAVYRDGAVSSTQALWFIRRSFDGGTSVLQWGGLPEDIPVPGDYDGDGKTDVAVYRNGTWLIVRSFDGGVTGIGWGGLPQDVPVPADYDGDGRTDFAVYRDGMWFILLANGGVIGTGWGGLAQDVPVPGDYDGDGKTDLAVYREGTWFILLANGGVITRGWGGLAQDVLVPGDYDGDRKKDVAVYRDGNWHIIRSSDGGVTSIGWGGLAQDIPLSRRND